MSVTTELGLEEVCRVFTDEAAAYELLESLRWPHGPVCPYCGSVDDAHFIKPTDGSMRTRTKKTTGADTSTSYRRIWRCHGCKKQFSVLVGTIFGDSHIPVGKWLMAFHLLCSGKNGVSAHELSRQLGITVKSAWFMAHRIRYAMARPPLSNKLAGVVEADETYIGGLAKNMHASKRAKTITGSGPKDKLPVVTLVERGGEARSMVMKPVSGKNVKRVLQEHVSPGAALMTDSHPIYTEPGQAFASHETVDHKNGEYVRGNAHSNTVEGFFSQLKRSIDGTHHHVSEQHLPRYLAEFDLRYSTRKEADAKRTVRMIRGSVGKRLTYKEPVDDAQTAEFAQ